MKITNPIPLTHHKRASAKEDIARNHLASALAKCPAALDSFLMLFFRGKVPATFQRRDSLRIETDVSCNGSFADLVLYAQGAVLCLEVKIDAQEQVGQYSKYRQFFEKQGFATHVAGLVKSRAEAKNPFLQGVPRFIWAELLEAFGQASATVNDLHAKLDEIDPQLKVKNPTLASSLKVPESLQRLSSDNGVLADFFQALLAELPKSFKGEMWQAGNSPNGIHVMCPQWQRDFVPGWYPKISLSLNKNTRVHAHAEPNFGFSVFLWHTDWCEDLDWFLLNRTRILGHFKRHNFNIVRNIPGKWHKQFDWHPPYETVTGLKYVNSFPRFKLLESEYTMSTWGETISMLLDEIKRIATVINRIKP